MECDTDKQTFFRAFYFQALHALGDYIMIDFH